MFRHKKEVANAIRKIPGSTFSGTLLCWHIPEVENYPEKVKSLVGDQAIVIDKDQKKEIIHIPTTEKTKSDSDAKTNSANIEVKTNHAVANQSPTPKVKIDTRKAEEIEKALHVYRNYLIDRRYRERTIESYTTVLFKFFEFLEFKDPSEIMEDDIRRFHLEYILKRKMSASYQNQVISAIKLYFRKFQLMQFNYEELERPRRSNFLPGVLDKQEVKSIIESIPNKKHRVIITLIYSCGLRISEAINMKLEHIDSKRMMITIKDAKGGKDRLVGLSGVLLELLRSYYQKYKPKEYLFEGQGGEKYSPESIRKVLRKAVIKCKIKKHVTPHTLRHSYGTHLLEGGTDLRVIQQLMGHKSSKTTEIYTHVSKKMITNVQSPLDDLKLDLGLDD